MDCRIDNTKLKSKAVQKLSTAKPGTMLAQSKIIKALITSKNKPNVINVMGKVRMTKIGFTSKLSNPKTIATQIAVIKLVDEIPCVPLRAIPGMKCEITMTKTAVIKILNNKFIFLVIG